MEVENIMNAKQHSASICESASTSPDALHESLRFLFTCGVMQGDSLRASISHSINSVPHIWSDPMKRILTASVLCLVIATSLRAGQAIPSVSAIAQQVSITMFGQPQKAEAKILPFVEGQLMSGKRERFGVQFGGVPTTTTVIEILGPGNNVIKTMSLNELLGNGSNGAITTRPSSVMNARRVETQYDIPTPGGPLQLIIRGIVTGDDEGSAGGQQLLVTFSLKGTSSVPAGLRVTLPVTGSAEPGDHGFIVLPKAGGVALGASVFPYGATTSIKNNRVVLTSPTASIPPNRDVANLWFVIASFAGSAPKVEAGKWLAESAPAVDDPRVVVVSSADKKATQPRDTVTYTLIFANIGTGTASDVSLSNPIPKGTWYLAQSATSNGFTVSFSHAGGAGSSEVTAITWKTPQPVLAGEERIVSFKVIVR
jgi:uncharacterized repeat protein (TIGR01451 family)